MIAQQISGAPQVSVVVKNPHANAGDVRDMGSVPGSGRSPGEGNGKPPQYSCLGNPMDRGAWWATAHWVPRAGLDFGTKPPPPLLGLPYIFMVRA